MEASAFEDALRELFGIHAYIVFTMDKIVQNIVRQVRALPDDVTSHVDFASVLSPY